MTPRYSEFAELLRRAMDRKGIGPNGLAKKLSISAAQINHWKSGHERPGLALLTHLCSILDLDAMDFPKMLRYSIRQYKELERIWYYGLSNSSNIETLIGIAKKARLKGELESAFDIYTVVINQLEMILSQGKKLSGKYSFKQLLRDLADASFERAICSRHFYQAGEIDSAMKPDIEMLRKIAGMPCDDYIDIDVKADFLEAERLYVHQHCTRANDYYSGVIEFTRNKEILLNSQRNLVLNYATLAAKTKGNNDLSFNYKAAYKKQYQIANRMLEKWDGKYDSDIPLLWEGMAKSQIILGKDNALDVITDLEKWCSGKDKLEISNQFWSVMRKRTRLIALATLSETKQDIRSIQNLADELLNITRSHNFIRLTYQIEATLRAGNYIFF